MIAQLVSPDDPRWRRLLNCVSHDAYQLPEYAAVSAHFEGGTPAAFYTEERDHALLVPLLIRELPQELGVGGKHWDTASPYGYSGPVATPGIPLETLRRALGRFHEVARENALVSAFIRLHPLRSVPVSAFEEHATVVNHGPVFYIDLSKSLDELWAETRPNHRRNIARLIRLGYVVEMDDWSAYPAFRLVYRRTMQRRLATTSYYFSDTYFDELREMLADHLHLCIVRAPNGEVAAGGLFVFTADVADYHLGGTADEYLPYAPSKLMFDFARRWAKARGASMLNLGGGMGGSSGSLHHFKKGFSRAAADRFTARFVFNEECYSRFTAMARNRGLVDESPDAFFPAYRQVYDGDTM
jgi:hypothetical protein